MGHVDKRHALLQHLKWDFTSAEHRNVQGYEWILCLTELSGTPFNRTTRKSLARTYPGGSHKNDSWLVVLTILKNMKVNQKDYPIYYGKTNV